MYGFVSTGGNPESFCFKTSCSRARHFFQAFPHCFHLGVPILSEDRVLLHRQCVEATSKMIVIMARGAEDYVNE